FHPYSAFHCQPSLGGHGTAAARSPQRLRVRPHHPLRPRPRRRFSPGLAVLPTALFQPPQTAPGADRSFAPRQPVASRFPAGLPFAPSERAALPPLFVGHSPSRTSSGGQAPCPLVRPPMG